MSSVELPTTPAFAPVQLLDALRQGLRRARERGRPVVVSRTDRLAELPDLVEIFAAAEQRGESRFFACRPADELSVLGLGNAACVEDLGPGEKLADRAHSLLDDVESAGAAADEGPWLLGGGAFRTLEASRREPTWRAFGNTRLVLPEIRISQRGGLGRLCWSVSVSPGEEEQALVHRVVDRWSRLLEKSPPATAHVTKLDAPPPEELSDRYAAAAARVISEIRSGTARKVVLAERERIRMTGARPTAAVLRALRDAHPGCLTFAQGIGDSTFLGSTPERLVRVRGGEVEAAAVAGTARAGNDPRASRKDRDEHDYVVQAIESVLGDLCTSVERPAAPELLDAGRAEHLSTALHGKLRAPTHVLDLVERLHPTPAVGGTPTDAALELIAAHESFDRGWYAGPIGWLDAQGQGEFHVALRCALLSTDTLLLYAGAGLIADSDPQAEAAETRLKLGTLHDALDLACAS